MAKVVLIFTVCLTAASLLPSFAQEKKAPFAGFAGTSLDRKPGQQNPPAKALPAPVAPAAPAARAAAGGAAAAGGRGLLLGGNWNAPNGLANGGPKLQRAELRALLTGYVAPAADLAAYPANRIYPPVSYLMPLGDAQARAGLGGKLQSGGRTSVVGFPDGLTFTAFSADGQRRYEVRMLKDLGDQVVAVEFASSDFRLLPPAPELLPPPTRSLRGHTYDFVPEGVTAAGREYLQNVWHMSDYVLIATRGGPKAADLYIPKPMVSLILYCLDRQPGR
jgi:hypothetical protein